MYRLTDGRLVLSPTDLVGHLYCEHLTALSVVAASEGLRAPTREDATLTVLTKRGMEHERRYLGHLEASGRSVVDISPEGTTGETASSFDRLRARERATAEAMDSGVAVIYQATFVDERDPEVVWRGHADFLRRVEDGADGHLHYEADDTKLARRVRPGAVVQLCSYAEQVARLQGSDPEFIHVVLGGNDRVSLPFGDFAAYFRAAKARLVSSVESPSTTYPNPVEHCSVCSWIEQCEERRIHDDHLSLVAGLTRDQARKLGRVGISTLAGLATSANDASVTGMAASTVATLRRQARLQLQHRDEGVDAPLPVELLPMPEDGERRGFGRLPVPSPGDVFFDIEGDPFAGNGGIEYLLGVHWQEGEESRYRAFWAHDPTAERQSFEALVDFVDARRVEYPDAHIYHYANYEPAALLKLASRYATRELEVDSLLKSGAFVDLYRVVREGMVIGSPSYSLKKIEPLYMESPRQEEVLDAAASIEAYERWLDTQDQVLLDKIEEYNKVDCISTRRLRDWLEVERLRLEQQTATPVPRPGRLHVEPDNGDEDNGSNGLAALVTALTEDLDDPPADRCDRARWVLGNLLNWHRREAKSAWHEYFERVEDYDDEDFIADPECVGGLSYTGAVGTVKQSTLHRYEFDPGQDIKLRAGDSVLDPASQRKKLNEEVSIPGPGSLEELEEAEGWLVLKRKTTSRAPNPTNLIPSGPIKTKPLSEALVRLGEYVRDHGIDSDGPWRAVRDLLIGLPPRRAQMAPIGDLRLPGESAPDAVARLVAELDQGCLAVQGPPGTGKTSTAGRFIAELVSDGNKVGVIANSHAVISNLLDAANRAARDVGSSMRGLQLCLSPSSRSRDPDVAQAKNAGEIENALDQDSVDLVGGTAWLFANESLHGRFDYLIVDEASQLSLANIAAAGGAARNVVLVGDPQQLSQPSQGVHPPLCGASALEYLLDGEDVLPPGRGIFLDRTHRLHPAICSYVSELSYRGELDTDVECNDQVVDDGPILGGSGIRWVPVDHQGNKTSSDEEAEAVRLIYSALLGRPWTNRYEQRSLIGTDDILVVAPYNGQVARIRQSLDGIATDAQVGTVDRFQGKEAAVVIVSMAASSADDIPRGMEFLYSRNRLNVAVSRAMALTVVVASPVLLAAHCRSVDQLRLANGLCRLAEIADTSTV